MARRGSGAITFNPGFAGPGMPAYLNMPVNTVGPDPFSVLKEIRVKGSVLLLALSVEIFANVLLLTAVMTLEGGPEYRSGLTGRDKTVKCRD